MSAYYLCQFEAVVVGCLTPGMIPKVLLGGGLSFIPAQSFCPGYLVVYG